MDEKEEKKNRGKYTELELRTRGVGKFFDTRTHEWATKLSTYHDEDVKRAYLAIKRSLALLCTDVDGYQYHEIAHELSQLMIDKFLLQRCKGQDVPIPGPVISESSLQAGRPKPGAQVRGHFESGGASGVESAPGIFGATSAMSDFTKWDGKIDTVSDINWIYNHLGVGDVKPEDAPSPGAWAHLQYHRSSAEAMAEFFTKVYPRLIPSKSVIQKMEDKSHDDGRTTFSLLNRLLEECEEGSEQVPVLQFGARKEPGLQDETG